MRKAIGKMAQIKVELCGNKLHRPLPFMSVTPDQNNGSAAEHGEQRGFRLGRGNR